MSALKLPPSLGGPKRRAGEREREGGAPPPAARCCSVRGARCPLAPGGRKGRSRGLGRGPEMRVDCSVPSLCKRREEKGGKEAKREAVLLAPSFPPSLPPSFLSQPIRPPSLTFISISMVAGRRRRRPPCHRKQLPTVRALIAEERKLGCAVKCCIISYSNHF